MSKTIIILFLFASIMLAKEEKIGNVIIDYQILSISNESFDVMLKFNIEKDWHIYWKNPGDAGLPTIFNWELPEGVELRNEQWTIPEIIPFEEFANIGYEYYTQFKFSFNTKHKLTEFDTIICYPSWLICKEGCYPDADTITIIPKENKGLIDNLVSRLDGLSNFPEIDKKIQTKAHIKDENLLLEIEGIESGFQKIYFLAEEQGYLSVTNQQFELNDDKKNLKIHLDELRERNPTKLKGLLIVELNDKEKIAYNISFNIKEVF